jgi:hypothetical protein
MDITTTLKRWGLPLGLALVAMGLGAYLRSVPSGHTAPKALPQLGTVVAISTSRVAIQWEGSHWVDTQHPTHRISQFEVSQWLGFLESMPVVRHVQPQPDADYGLASPVDIIHLVTDQGKKMVIKIGRVSPRNGVYLQVNGTLIVVGREWAAKLIINGQSFRDRQPFRDIKLASMNAMEIQGPPGLFSESGRPIKVVQAPVSQWWWVHVTSNVIAPSDSVTRVLQLVKGMTVNDYVVTPSEGVDWQITLSGADTPTVVGKILPNHTTVVKLPTGEWGVVYPALVIAIRELARHPMAETPIRWDRFNFKRVEVTTSQNSIMLLKNSVGHWMDPNGKPRTVRLHNVFALLKNFTPTGNRVVVRDRVRIRIGTQEIYTIGLTRSGVISFESTHPRAILYLKGEDDELEAELIKLTAP